MMTTYKATPTFDKRFLRFNEENRVGLAVMAIECGVTNFKKGYGLRDLETGGKVDCNTNFRMASISKQFTAMCVAILEEKGKLKTDNYISQYLPDTPQYMKKIKVGHLVHHLSGLPDYSHALWSDDKSKPYLNNQDIFSYYKKLKNLSSKPGKKFNYSNGGYSLLALVIESAADQSLPNFTEHNIFKPANMTNSAIITYPSTIRNQAISYSGWPFFNDIDFNTGNALQGEDGVYTSLADMQGWIHALENNSLVSESTTKRIFSPVPRSDGKKVRYGYGWEFGKFHNYKVAYHQGGWVGFNTVILTVPKKRLWLVAFSNSDAISSWSAMTHMFKHYLGINN